MLNFVGFINENVDLTEDQKQAMLNDFCLAYGYAATSGRAAFANTKIGGYIINTVNRARKESVAIEELVLDDGTVILP